MCIERMLDDLPTDAKPRYFCGAPQGMLADAILLRGRWIIHCVVARTASGGLSLRRHSPLTFAMAPHRPRRSLRRERGRPAGRWRARTAGRGRRGAACGRKGTGRRALRLRSRDRRRHRSGCFHARLAQAPQRREKQQQQEVDNKRCAIRDDEAAPKTSVRLHALEFVAAGLAFTRGSKLLGRCRLMKEMCRERF